jgi:hypothetical protein
MGLLCIEDAVELVFVVRSAEVATADTILGGIKVGEVLPERLVAFPALDFRYAFIDDAGVFALTICSAIRFESPPFTKVVDGSAQFFGREWTLQGLGSEHVGQLPRSGARGAI